MTRSSFIPLEARHPRKRMSAETKGFLLLTGFTLIELLIVIAIIAVLAIVVILTLNPSELLKQARDSNRLSDLETLNKAISIYETDTLGQGSLGNSSTTYFSLVDQTATTTAGTNCEGIPLTPPPNWTYRCSASSTYRLVNGEGWLPVNFSQISSGSPIGQLPIDPQNTSSTQYYTYTPGSSWALTSLLESQKYLQTKAKDDGGYDPGRYELGSNLSLIPRSEGLQGYWDFEEGSGTTAKDKSGNANNGTWSGTGTHYAAGKVGTWAGQFNGTDDYVTRGSQITSAWQGLSYGAWFKTSTTNYQAIVNEWSGGANFALQESSAINAYLNTSISAPGWKNNVTAVVSDGSWHHVMVIYDGATEKVYLDGAEVYSTAGSGTVGAGSAYYFKIGAGANASQVAENFFSGLIDEVRLYNRALSAAEIKAMYDATK